MIISSFYQYLYIHIPKNAGSSVSWSLTHYHGGFFREQKHDTYYIAIQNYPHEAHYFTFAFVRNPFTRLVSWWNYLNSTEGNRESSKNRIKLFLEDVPTFKAFVYALPKNHKGRLKFFYFQKPQYDYLSTCGKIGIDFVGKVENLKEDWGKICDQFNWEEKLEMPVKKKTKTVEYYEDYYTEEMTEIVFDYFKKDFKEFNYEVPW